MTRQSISDLWDNSQEPKIHVNCSPKKGVCEWWRWRGAGVDQGKQLKK